MNSAIQLVILLGAIVVTGLSCLAQLAYLPLARRAGRVRDPVRAASVRANVYMRDIHLAEVTFLAGVLLRRRSLLQLRAKRHWL